ncbi:unnamed protein product, partial [Ectocarpus sp. 8 AP-2014]
FFLSLTTGPIALGCSAHLRSLTPASFLFFFEPLL